MVNMGFMSLVGLFESVTTRLFILIRSVAVRGAQARSNRFANISSKNITNLEK